MKRTLLSVAVFVLAYGAPSAAAQDDVDAELALALAQVCANESSLFRGTPADCALIWQATRSHGRTNAERLTWLRAHSSCVLTEREMNDDEVETNCRWSRGLRASNDRPAGWPDHWSWERASERWEAMRAVCARLVAGRRPSTGWPCESDPDTWGGRMDQRRAVLRGMEPVECTGTFNQGYFYARRQRALRR